jgi:hypothetical protein
MEESRRFGPAYDWVQTNHDTCHPVTECYAAPIYNRYGLISGAMIVVGAIVNAVRSFRDIESRGDSLTRDGPGDARASRSTDWYGGAQTEAAAMPTVESDLRLTFRTIPIAMAIVRPNSNPMCFSAPTG